MIYIIFLLNIILVIYFFFKYPGIVAIYLLLFQDIPQVIFSNLGMPGARYIFYFLLLLIYLLFYFNDEVRKSKIRFGIVNPILAGIFILVFGMLYHVYFFGFINELGAQIVISYIVQNLPLILIAALYFSNKKHLNQMGYGVIIWGVFFFFILLVTDSLSMAVSDRMAIRDATNINPIGMGRLYGMILIASSIIFYYEKKIEIRILCVFALLISVYVMIIAASRGPILATLMALTVYYIVKSRGTLNKIKILALLGTWLVIVIIFIQMTDFSILGRFEALADYEQMKRFRRIMISREIIVNYFLIGLGPGGFAHLTGLHYPHNLILEMVLEYGLFGVVSMGFVFLPAFMYAYKIINSNKLHYSLELFIPIWFMYLLAAMVSSHIAANREVWVLSGLLISMYYLADRKGKGLIIFKKV